MVELVDGSWVDYGVLLFVIGVELNKLNVFGVDLLYVCMLCFCVDCDVLIVKLKIVCCCVVVGVSFIGFEVVVVLCMCGFDVYVVVFDLYLMGCVFGDVFGDMIKVLYEVYGVVFYFGVMFVWIGLDSVMLLSGDVLLVDVVLVGIGVYLNVEFV